MREISVFTLKDKLENNESFILLDVREKPELDICALEEAMHIPMMSIPRMLSELDKNTPIVAMCHTGVRSSQACLYLMQHGYDVVNLQGGIDAWAKEIDPRLKQY